jgi:type II secretory pathway component GspD/PulD (secretin)
VVEEISALAPTNSTSRVSSSPASTLVTNQVRVGEMVDIYPVVGSNGYSIQLTVSGTATEFAGYDDPGQFDPQADAARTNTPLVPLAAQLPLPRFRVLQMPTHSAAIWDGHTLVLGRSDQTDTNQIPVFGGDRPQLGRLFRGEPKDKELIIFVTPTIVDPDGNRVHSDDEMPGPVPKSR